MKRIVLAILALSALSWSAAVDDLEKNFTTPPEGTRPRCYWYWMDGHITKEGITHDLEAMRRVGIGEGDIGIISGQSGVPAADGPKALTPEWWAFIEHAVQVKYKCQSVLTIDTTATPPARSAWFWGLNSAGGKRAHSRVLGGAPAYCRLTPNE